MVYVEDDERLARLTSQYLRSHGVEVHLVARADLALADATSCPVRIRLIMKPPGIGETATKLTGVVAPARKAAARRAVRRLSRHWLV